MGSPAQMAEILNRLRSIDMRLAAVERHLGLAAHGARTGRGAEEPAPRSGPAAPPEDEGPAAQAGPQGG